MGHLLRPFRRLQWQLTLTYMIITVVAALTIEAANVVGNVAAITSLTSPSPEILVADMQHAGSQIAPYLDTTAPNLAALDGYTQTLADLAGSAKVKYTVTFEEAQASPSKAIGMKSHGSQVTVTILDVGGRVLTFASSDGTAAGRWNRTLPVIERAFAALYANPQRKDRHLLQTLDDGRILSAVPLVGYDGRTVGTLVMALLLAPPIQTRLSAALYTIQQNALLPSALVFVFLAMVVGTLSGMLASRSIRRRLSRITQTAQAWSRGELEAEIQPMGQDELGQLARDLTSMAGQLQRLMVVRQELAVVEERHRLARELHDAVKQQLFVVTMLLGTARTQVAGMPVVRQTLTEAERLASQAQQELTGLIRALRPVGLANGGLGVALRSLVEEWTHRTGVAVETEIAGELTLTAMAEQELFRVVQEALTNVARHSDATMVVLRAGVERQHVIVSVADNGHGFDRDAHGTRGAKPGLGLESMRERVEALGGLLLVSSSAAGTRIEARVPVRAEGDVANTGLLAAPGSDGLEMDVARVTGDERRGG